MPMDTREDQLERRIAALTADDPQFAAARPDEAVATAVQRPGCACQR
ncbi:thioester reductase domain protein [Mycobacterium xenopi 4042]|uniref:Thioester reductase domain protein n=1 Tax=Mycobacterium xenopi 4042 TaxID=1299334 RepID=X8DJ65_MYCXE|nr:thioester reductase domain protein [Mycobacterium xenopi 3993]EUA68424.1 thioester reductase domain protein [Mycobacterium xenopi 4042]